MAGSGDLPNPLAAHPQGVAGDQRRRSDFSASPSETSGTARSFVGNHVQDLPDLFRGAGRLVRFTGLAVAGAPVDGAFLTSGESRA